MDDTANAGEIESLLAHPFTDRELIVCALTHRSFTNENKGATHNERLEFLGDAVLQFIVTTHLYRLYPDEPEGVLSIYRSLLVKTDFLIQVAKKLDLQQYLRVSEGQKKDCLLYTSPSPRD